MEESPRTRAPYDGAGSVRRAREMMEAALAQQGKRPPQVVQPTQSPPRQRPSDMQNTGQVPMPTRPKQPFPTATTSSNSASAVGIAISRPTPIPQWPLAGTFDSNNSTRDQQYQPPAGKEKPQRPPRPSNVPSMLDSSRVQEYTPAFQYRPQPEISQQYRDRSREQSFIEDDITSPTTLASRASTVSSAGSIPDFPMPTNGPELPSNGSIPTYPPIPPSGTARRSANLGPPPSARRGASSYYSMASFVSPIPEESPRMPSSHNSYASSAAIPSEWNSSTPRSYDNDTIEEGRESREGHVEDSDEPGLVRNASIGRRGKPSIVDADAPETGLVRSASIGRRGKPSIVDADAPETGLVRSASIGRRGKPSMVTTKSSDRLERGTGSQKSDKSDATLVPVPALSKAMATLKSTDQLKATIAQSVAKAMESNPRNTTWPTFGGPDSPTEGDKDFRDTLSSSGSDSTAFSTYKAPIKADTTTALGTVNENIHKSPVQNERNFSRLSAIRKPPRLDIDAVRDAEARGSLTSLPDLIRRATRLASMMDRGKRPGSRLHDLNDMINSATPQEKNQNKDKHNSGLSGMLSAFPPPAIGTPSVTTPKQQSPHPGSAWPSPYEGSTRGLRTHDDNREENELPPRKPRRRCCGMSPFYFLITAFIIAAIIAAAVVVPLELLVINKPKTASTALSALQTCQQTMNCQNGGTSIVNSTACSCICANGFTGSTCTIAGSGGCATIDVTGLTASYTNVTLGAAMPRLITQAETNFSIPLFYEIILSRFNTANLSCDVENALVTFDGLSNRVGEASTPVNINKIAATGTPVARRRSRVEVRSESETVNPTILVAAAPTKSVASTTASATPTPSASAVPTSTTSAGGAVAFAITEEAMDFARVAVLYILQEQQLSSAVTAQSKIQAWMNAGVLAGYSNAGNVSVGDGNTVNFQKFRVDIGMGVIGKP